MNMDLFIAALLASATFTIAGYLLAIRKLGKSARPALEDDAAPSMRLENAFSDLVSELQHVANSHGNAVEDRKEELKRVLDLANERIRKITGLLADMEILEKRLRQHATAIRDTIVEDEAARGSDDLSAKLVREARPVAARDGGLRGGGPGRRQQLLADIESLLVAGRTPAEIAATLHLQRNEVELMIRLLERSSNGGSPALDAGGDNRQGAGSN